MKHMWYGLMLLCCAAVGCGDTWQPKCKVAERGTGGIGPELPTMALVYEGCPEPLGAPGMCEMFVSVSGRWGRYRCYSVAEALERIRAGGHDLYTLYPGHANWRAVGEAMARAI